MTSGESSDHAQPVLSVLSDLPTMSPTAFSNYDPSAPADSPRLYLPSPDDVSHAYPIPTERRRCLIRALTARPPLCGKRTASAASDADVQTTGARVAEDREREREMKRPRWTALDRERKQACLRVALSAACKQLGAPRSLHNLKEGWARNPRMKQLIDGDVRRALAASVPSWSSHELREYLARAGIVAGAMGRVEMTRVVESHITPDRGAAAAAASTASATAQPTVTKVRRA